MKKVEELEKEYEVFETKLINITNLEEFFFLLFHNANKMALEVKGCNNDFKRNKRKKRLNKIKQMITKNETVSAYLFGKYLEENDAVLKNVISLIYSYADYINKMIDIATEDNIGEIVRLFDFLSKCYNEHIAYYDEKRTNLQNRIKGLQVRENPYEEYRYAVDSFTKRHFKMIEQEINNTDKNPVIYKKK